MEAIFSLYLTMQRGIECYSKLTYGTRTIIILIGKLFQWQRRLNVFQCFLGNHCLIQIEEMNRCHQVSN